MKRIFLLLLAACGCEKPAGRVVLYSAQDREFAEPLFDEFQTRNTLSITGKFDTEANKSVSLANELLAERDHARADVHWNNEPINTIRLARQGVYETYTSPWAETFPEWTKAKDGTWQMFAARARVLIVNTNLVPEAKRPTSIFDLTKPEWKGKAAMAKPLFGTTATHAACLFEVMGSEHAKGFFRGIKRNDVAILAGNKPVAVKVAAGEYAFGLTDSDDAIIELNAGKPVAIVFPNDDYIFPSGYVHIGVLFLPNTLALVKGGPNPEGGRKLIDYLLRMEPKLTTGGGFQIPLNPRVEAKVPAALRTPQQVNRMKVDFEKVADRWDEVQEFLRNEFAK